MKRRTQFVTLLSLGGALMMGSAAHAQMGNSASGSSGYPGGSSSMGSSSGSGGATGAGAVNNASFNSTSDTTTASTASPSTPPNTGGEPLLMSLLGSLTAGSALLLRRKVR